MTENLPQVGGTSLEDLKQINQHGAEYWSARDLQSLLGYTQWRSFEKAIQKAVTSCEQSGNEPAHHFARAAQNGQSRLQSGIGSLRTFSSPASPAI